MENLSYLLRELSLLVQNLTIQEKSKETFNVFDSMMKRTDEKNLHSRFISILLDPWASHKTGDLFLKLFLQAVGIDFAYNLESLETYPNENYRSEYKNIDLLLIDRQTKSAIIIENKIYATDANHENEGQLEKYYRTIIEEGIPASSIIVIYLTLDREGPSTKSVATSKLYPDLENKVININYGNQILDWLKECCKETLNKPIIREIIIQYSNLLKKMTNNISEEHIKELMGIIGQNRDNLRGTQLLMNNLGAIKEQSIWSFWNELTSTLKANHYTIRKAIRKDECHNLIFGGPRICKIDFNLEITSKKGLYLTVNIDYYGCLCVGVSEKDAQSGQYNRAKSFYSAKKDFFPLDKEKGWLFYKIIYFPEDYCDNLDIFGNKKPSLDFVDYHNDLFVNLISSSERKKIISHIYKEIEDLVMYYNDFN